MSPPPGKGLVHLVVSIDSVHPGLKTEISHRLSSHNVAHAVLRYDSTTFIIMRVAAAADGSTAMGSIVTSLQREGIEVGTVKQLSEEERQYLIKDGVLPPTIPYAAMILPTTALRYNALRPQSSRHGSGSGAQWTGGGDLYPYGLRAALVWVFWEGRRYIFGPRGIGTTCTNNSNSNRGNFLGGARQTARGNAYKGDEVDGPHREGLEYDRRGPIEPMAPPDNLLTMVTLMRPTDMMRSTMSPTTSISPPAYEGQELMFEDRAMLNLNIRDQGLGLYLKDWMRHYGWCIFADA
ncbi:hypothetical protein BC832DRAFT_540880 [Gaertneriomyces semiglobifer]|nr:hypothetical protein BC832DRAFT_540880 [Gaertneriomyces semiglobifer]